MEALASYDVERPPRNFLSVRMKNRLHNLKRDLVFRSYAPCSCCNPFDPPPKPCDGWPRWDRANSTKSSLAAAGGVTEFRDPAARLDEEDHKIPRKINRLVDETFDGHLRADLQRLQQGVAVPEPWKTAFCRTILKPFSGAYTD